MTEKRFKKKNNLDGKFVIKYVGAHGVANNLDQILNAGKVLEDTNVLFLLIGQGMEKQRLINKAKELNIQNVRFLDSVPKSEVFKYIIASEMGASVLKKVDAFKTVYSNKTFDYFYYNRVASVVSEKENNDILFIENLVIQNHKFPSKDIILSDAVFLLEPIFLVS